ncbi:VWA-like domain-containing protein [Acetonema longum]|uniref:von Willebrand factor type A n=1 Tax=Acetonema longum DSM 6540 TaxID=1009370 RepID=F7NJB2_9FIRM|nr:VWA-like domain-containing protein [Acetonema longum]EGO63860.1 von Willebrand factor type A [Acetonema longum DSM 6540]
METFDTQAQKLYIRSYELVQDFLRAARQNKSQGPSQVHIPADFAAEFFRLVDKVNLGLMEDKDNFYGYFLFQMSKEIRFDISSPTGVNFKAAKYVIYFNPVIFLTLTLKQMETTIKHEILHVVSLHLIRAKELRGSCSALAMNIAMDITINTYLDYLPPYATTLEWVNLNYGLKLLPFETFEYYAAKVQTALDLLEEAGEATEDPGKNQPAETAYDPEKTHDIWQRSDPVDEQTLRGFTEKVIDASQKGSIPAYLESLISSLKSSKADLSWNLYLQRLMGSVTSNPKKTVTRRNRRQPDRLDLRGELKSYKAKIAVALDISGSISDEEFNQAVKEVLSIVKNYNHEILMIECDSEIRRVYTLKSVKDIKSRSKIRGSTRFTPVFEFANTKKLNLLVYFTDGKGEDELRVKPKGYKTLWVISGKGDRLSLKEAYGVVKKLDPIEIKTNEWDMIQVEKGGYSMNHQEKIGM